jgi:uncharacterized protein
MEAKSPSIVKRSVNILKNQSFFLFGPRGTGKSTLIRQFFEGNEHDCLWIDLLEAKTERLYTSNPDRLSEILHHEHAFKCVVIDEVQKIPKLLDVVHKEIFNQRAIFALTGSSARKLKRGGANMLAGRAFVYHLHPLTFEELGTSFDLDSALRWGTLPGIFALTTDDEKSIFLESYVYTYLREEIIAEQLIRKVEPFRRFLDVLGQCNGTIINYSKIAEDIRVDLKTVKTYFEIIEDTLIGFILPAYSKSIRKQQKTSSKFYLFDCGVKRSLENLSTLTFSNSGEFGLAFEHFIILEFIRLNQYKKKNYRFSYLATKGGLEIDLVIERPRAKTVFIEIKSTDEIQDRHLEHLRAIKKDFPEVETLCLCREQYKREKFGVEIYPWKEGFKSLDLIS